MRALRFGFTAGRCAVWWAATWSGNPRSKEVALEISREQIGHLCELAQLRLTPEEELQLAHDLIRVLRFMERLQRAETDLTRLQSDPAGGPSRWREDEPGHEMPSAGDVLGQAAERAGHYFAVPSILRSSPGGQERPETPCNGSRAPTEE
jgi:aspartyl/glutamyl-tRNA(Asn/Gln) amidotransferase C subunit